MWLLTYITYVVPNEPVCLFVLAGIREGNHFMHAMNHQKVIIYYEIMKIISLAHLFAAFNSPRCCQAILATMIVWECFQTLENRTATAAPQGLYRHGLVVRISRSLSLSLSAHEETQSAFEQGINCKRA